MKSEIADILKEKNDLEHKLTNKINKMVDHLTLHRDIGIIYPLEVDIPASSSLLGKKICEIEFWNYTGATIIGIKREGNNTLSPNPEWILEAEDTIVFVGKRIPIHALSILLNSRNVHKPCKTRVIRE